jgi:FAD/FMN-containing dehydrogenases
MYNLNKSKGYFSTWSNSPVKLGELVTLKTIKKIQSLIPYKKPFIPVGNFKSYGDCALSDTMVKFDPVKTIQINRQNQTATVSSNVLIGDLIQKTIPMGLFPIVVPGTKFVTIGGAIAADIHGKNHHLDGCFSDHVISFEIITSNGRTVLCDRNKNQELWKLTCGGMGLTGVITSAKLKLKKVNSSTINQTTVKASSIDGLFDYFEKNNKDTYSVAWVDCTAKNDSLGRGIFISGDFSSNPKDQRLIVHKNPKFSIPFLMPKIFN